MAKKYTCPPQNPSGAGTFADDLVGFQLVQGGGLTQGNFQFTQSVTEKSNRSFEIGTFSGPITLDTLQIESINESREIVAKNYQVYPNFDLSDVTNFTLYGSLNKRLSVAVQGIINYFPASFESNKLSPKFIVGNSAYNIIYDSISDQTTFDIDVKRIFNPFGIDFSENSSINITSKEMTVSYLRDFSKEYQKYSMFTSAGTFDVVFTEPSVSTQTGVLSISVKGNPFSGQVVTQDNLIFRPNDYYVELQYNDSYDEVQKFLLNRLINPPYTAVFDVPSQSTNGLYYFEKRPVTWPKDGPWNLDIRSTLFTNYLTNLSEIAIQIDEFKTNLISRFLTTGSLKDFDTEDQKTEKLLQIYGRSFDETKKFIDALAHINSVNYNVSDDIPSQLLKNLSQTLGWQTNISPIAEDNFLDSVFGNTSEIEFPGYSRPLTPNELNYQFYRNLILNSAYLFKSKGTRKSIETLMRLIGAPEALVEFNENIYLADQVINMNKFQELFANISGGIYAYQSPVLDSTILFSIQGTGYTGFNSVYQFETVTTTIDDYPVDLDGYPYSPIDNDDYYFQKGAGWIESTPQHRSPEIIDVNLSVFTGSNPSVQTGLEPFTYGQKYLDRYRIFPYMKEGFKITKVTDNKKSWTTSDSGLRRYSDGGFNSYYYTYDEKLVINVKNIELFLNPAQGLAYDVWVMSNKYDYPIPQTGFTSPYPAPYGVDWTVIDPKPKKLTFFEFAQTFWRNMINVRDRQFNTDGKTSGYPTLQSMWWAYLNSGLAINVPNDNFTYQTMIDYVVGLGDYWLRLVEQMIPATTIWNGGFKYENSILHRQKFVWRRQAGCQILSVPCIPCQLQGPLFTFDCPNQTVLCTNLFPQQVNPLTPNFGTVLSSVITSTLPSTVDFSNCLTTTITSTWSIVLESGTTTTTLPVELVNYEFFYGYGLATSGFSYPTESQYILGVLQAFDELYNVGLYYDINLGTSINNSLIKFLTIDCRERPSTDYLIYRINIDYNIFCN